MCTTWRVGLRLGPQRWMPAFLPTEVPTYLTRLIFKRGRARRPRLLTLHPLANPAPLTWPVSCHTQRYIHDSYWHDSYWHGSYWPHCGGMLGDTSGARSG